MTSAYRFIAFWTAAALLVAGITLFGLYRRDLGRKYVGVDIVAVTRVRYTGNSPENAALRNMTRVSSDSGTAITLCGDESSRVSGGVTYRMETRAKELNQSGTLTSCQELLSIEAVPVGYDLEVHSGTIAKVEHSRSFVDEVYPYGINLTLENKGQRKSIRICNDATVSTLRDLHRHRVDLVINKTAYSHEHNCFPLVAFRRDDKPQRYVLPIGLVLAPVFDTSAGGYQRSLKYVEKFLDRLFPVVPDGGGFAEVEPQGHQEDDDHTKKCESRFAPISLNTWRSAIDVIVAGRSCEGEASDEITVTPDPSKGTGTCTLDVGGTIDSMKKVPYQGGEVVLVNTSFRMYSTEYLVHWNGAKLVARVRLEGDAAYETLEEFTCETSRTEWK